MRAGSIWLAGWLAGVAGWLAGNHMVLLAGCRIILGGAAHPGCWLLVGATLHGTCRAGLNHALPLVFLPTINQVSRLHAGVGLAAGAGAAGARAGTGRACRPRPAAALHPSGGRAWLWLAQMGCNDGRRGCSAIQSSAGTVLGVWCTSCLPAFHTAGQALPCVPVAPLCCAAGAGQHPGLHPVGAGGQAGWGRLWRPRAPGGWRGGDR